MNNLQDTLLFPFQDAESRKQFLFACLVALAGFIIPLIPMVILTGYAAKIMRQIIEERRKPSMPDWQDSDWSEMFRDGLRIYGAQIVWMLPIFIIMGIGFIMVFGGSIGLSFSANQDMQTVAPVGAGLLALGVIFILIFSLLALPYAVIVGAVGPHVAVTRSFESAFRFKEWWSIFRKALAQFVLAYIIAMAITWVFTFIAQIAMLTVILICVLPFLMIPFVAYNVLLRNALNAQAYAIGSDNLKTE